MGGALRPAGRGIPAGHRHPSLLNPRPSWCLVPRRLLAHESIRAAGEERADRGDQFSHWPGGCRLRGLVVFLGTRLDRSLVLDGRLLITAVVGELTAALPREKYA